MTGPTGADQPTWPDVDWDQVLKDRRNLVDEQRRWDEQDVDEPTDPPPPPGR